MALGAALGVVEKAMGTVGTMEEAMRVVPTEEEAMGGRMAEVVRVVVTVRGSG